MQAGSLSDWLSGLSTIEIGIGILVLMIIAAAVGRYVRKLQQRISAKKHPESGESVAQEGYLLGSALGLLGLLLAFSFGMVLDRYESRRELVVKEANAIGTAYLRAQLLDEPHRSQLSKLLVDYADNRLKLASAEGHDTYLARNDELLIQIWGAVRASRESALAHGLTTTLLMVYNEIIDLDTERKVAWNLRLPAEVLGLLILYLAVTATVVGHQVDGPRGRRAAGLLFVLISISVAVIADINRPITGRARDDEKPLEMVLQSLRQQPPQVFDRYSQRANPEAGR